MAGDDRIDIVFGARVGELLAGVAESKEAIEGLRAPIDSFIGHLGGIAEAIGAAFAVEKIAEFAKEMAELGEKTMNAAAAVGTTPEKFSELSVTMALAGGNAETATRAMELLGTHLIEAVNNPASRAAAALKDLGISQAEAKRATTDLDYAFRLLAETFAKSEAGFARTADFRALIGRGMDQLIPLLRRGGEGYDEFKKKAEETGAVLNEETAKSMEVVAEHIKKMSADLSGLGVSSWKLFGDSINKTVGELDFIIGVIKDVIDWLLKLRTAIDNAFGAFDRAVGRGYTTGQSAEDIAAGGGASAAIPAGGEGKLRHLTGPEKAGKKGAKGSDDRMSVWRDELHQRLQDEGNFFNDSKAAELAFWQAKLATVGNGTKEDIKLRRELNSQIFTLQKELAKQTEKNAIEEQTYAEKSNDEIIKRKQAQVAADVSLNKMSAMDGITAERQLLDEKYRANEDYYNKKLQAALQDKETTKKLGLEENIQYEKYLTERQALDIKAAEASKARWETIIGPIKSALSNAAQGVAMGTETLGQAGKNVGQAVIGEAISKSMSAAMDKLGSLLTTVLPEAMKSFLGIGEATAQIAAITTGSAVVATAVEVGAAGTIAAIWGAMATSKAVPGFAAGGIVSAQRGWVIPSAASGMLINAHAGEAVLPEHWTKGLDAMFRGGQGGGGGGGGDNHLHLHAAVMDGPSLKRWHTELMQSNPDAIRNLFKKNAITPRNS